MLVPQWMQELKEGIHKTEDLASLKLSDEEISEMTTVANTYKIRVPRYYLNLIDWDNPNDPIRQQIMPSIKELTCDERELEDPIGDLVHSPTDRLTHRYPDRVLIYPTYQCSAYCRFCFRKNQLRENSKAYSNAAIEPALQYVKEHPEVQEVILTGGDPLMLMDHELEYIRERIEQIGHIRMIRIHTRMIATLPHRITPDFITALKGRTMKCVVTHINHPREITSETAAACQRIRQAGYMLLNQSVILRGVNNHVETLKELMREMLYTLGVKPYYWHHCDLARGAGHFRTKIAETHELIQQLRGYVSGLCIPTYVLDLPGGYGKIPIGPAYVKSHDEHVWNFSTYRGESYSYQEIVS
jgi:lysine 2,3-aminomutase